MSKYHIIDYSCTSGYDDKADCNTMAEVMAHAKDYLSEGATNVYVFRDHKLVKVIDRRFKRGRQPLQSEIHQFDETESKLSDHILQIAKDEDAIMRIVLKQQGGGMGGIICSVIGHEGRYDVESIYMDSDVVKCHIWTSFRCERDIRFDSLPIWERMQIIERALKIANMIK